MTAPREPLPPDLKPAAAALNLADRLRNWWAWAFILWSCLFLGPVLIVAMAALHPFGRAHRLGDAVVHWWVNTLRRIWRVQIEVAGLDAVDPRQTYVVASNHRSHLDAVACLLALHPRLHFGFVVKRSLARIPIWGWFISLNGYVPVDRGGKRGRDQLAPAVLALQRGRSVLVFPEGTRAPDHRFRPFKKGAAQLALRAGCPVLPLTVSGTATLLPRNDLYVRPGRIRVDVHPPIQTAGRDLSQRDDVTAEVRAAIVSGYRLGVDETPAGRDPALALRVSGGS